jgi:protein-S-isoprenylcysteine O-methyltransferase Ste14
MGVSLAVSHGPAPQKLCTSGPFKYSRNPIYAAFVLPLAAHGYYSIVAAVLSISLYMIITTTLIIHREERLLLARFGATYHNYRHHTPRWFFF